MRDAAPRFAGQPHARHARCRLRSSRVDEFILVIKLPPLNSRPLSSVAAMPLESALLLLVLPFFSETFVV